MATYTNNLNLKKPATTDKIRIADFNNNADLIDAGYATQDSSLGKLGGGMAIISTGNVHGAISAGQFVYVRKHGTLTEGLYTADSNISANATLSASNLTAVSNGGLNVLNSNIRKVHYQDYEIPLTSSSGRTVSMSANITGYFLIGASFVQNDDLYYLVVTDGIYPNLSIVDGTVQYIQLLGMNKSFNQVGANRTIKVRALYTKS